IPPACECPAGGHASTLDGRQSKSRTFGSLLSTGARPKCDRGDRQRAAEAPEGIRTRRERAHGTAERPDAARTGRRGGAEGRRGGTRGGRDGRTAGRDGRTGGALANRREERSARAPAVDHILVALYRNRWPTAVGRTPDTLFAEALR